MIVINTINAKLISLIDTIFDRQIDKVSISQICIT